MPPIVEDYETASESDGERYSVNQVDTPPTSYQRGTTKDSVSAVLPRGPSPSVITKRSQEATTTSHTRAVYQDRDDAEVFTPSSLGSARKTYSRGKHSGSEPQQPHDPVHIRGPLTSDPLGTPQLVEKAVARSLANRRGCKTDARTGQAPSCQAQETSTVGEAVNPSMGHSSDSEDILASENNLKPLSTPQRSSQHKRDLARDTEHTSDAVATSATADYDETANGEKCHHDQDDTAADDTDEEPPRKRPRLPKAATEEDDSGVEISVASSRNSPRVLIKNTSGASLMTGRHPKVLISGDDAPKALKTWFRRKKVDLIENVPSKRTHFVCVVKNKRLPSTLKVLHSLVAGKLVVTDTWMIDSKEKGEFLMPETYVHPDLQRSIYEDRTSLFSSTWIFFTNRAADSYSDWQGVEEMLRQAGAVSVERGTAHKGQSITPRERVILLGEGDERDVAALTLLKEHGRVVYNKGFIAQIILKAELDLNSDEHRLVLPLGGKARGKER